MPRISIRRLSRLLLPVVQEPNLSDAGSALSKAPTQIPIASPISGTGTNPRPASAVGATSACVRAKVIVPTPVAAVIDTPVIALFVTLKEPPATEVPVMVMSPEVVGIFPSRTSTVTVATLLVRATCVICSSVVGPVAFDPKAYPGTPGRSNSGGGATGDAL